MASFAPSTMMTLTASMTSANSLTSKMQALSILSAFLGLSHFYSLFLWYWSIKNPIFQWYLTLWRPVCGTYYLHEMNGSKVKCSLLLNMVLKEINKQTYWSFYLSEPFNFIHFNVRHHVTFYYLVLIVRNLTFQYTGRIS